MGGMGAMGASSDKEAKLGNLDWDCMSVHGCPFLFYNTNIITKPLIVSPNTTYLQSVIFFFLFFLFPMQALHRPLHVLDTTLARVHHETQLIEFQGTRHVLAKT